MKEAPSTLQSFRSTKRDRWILFIKSILPIYSIIINVLLCFRHSALRSSAIFIFNNILSSFLCLHKSAYNISFSACRLPHCKCAREKCTGMLNCQISCVLLQTTRTPLRKMTDDLRIAVNESFDCGEAFISSYRVPCKLFSLK